MLIPKWQRVALRAVTLRHLIARLGILKRIALGRSLLAATTEQQGNKYHCVRQLHFQILLTAFLKARIVTVGLGWNVRTMRREIISCHSSMPPPVAPWPELTRVSHD